MNDIETAVLEWIESMIRDALRTIAVKQNMEWTPEMRLCEYLSPEEFETFKESLLDPNRGRFLNEAMMYLLWTRTPEEMKIPFVRYVMDTIEDETSTDLPVLDKDQTYL